MSAPRIVAGVLVAGWLASSLAAKDADVEAGIVAYQAGDYEEALVRFDAARERRPERPELAFNRGLVLLGSQDVESAQTAFETASEAEDSKVRSSALYELGNLAFDAQDYETAIARYIECLKARPDHANAKWNLELALLEKKKQEEEQEEEDEQEEDEQEEDEQEEDEQEEDEQEEDEQEEDEQEEDEQEEDEQEEQDEQEQDEQEQDEEEQEQEQEQEQDEQEQDQQPRPIDEMDVNKALEQLDEQDPFTLDRPVGGYVQPDKDW